MKIPIVVAQHFEKRRYRRHVACLAQRANLRPMPHHLRERSDASLRVIRRALSCDAPVLTRDRKPLKFIASTPPAIPQIAKPAAGFWVKLRDLRFEKSTHAK